MRSLFALIILTLLLTGCAGQIRRPQLPPSVLQEEASLLYSQYRVTTRGSYFFKKYQYNGTGYQAMTLSPLFDEEWVSEASRSLFDRHTIYNVLAITGALMGGFSLGYNFGIMARDKKSITWVWITGASGTAAMFLFQYLGERSAAKAFGLYNRDLQIKLGLAPEGTVMTSPHKKNREKADTSPAGLMASLGLTVRF